MTSFIIEAGSVVMVTEHGPVRLNEDQCERLLDIWQEAEPGEAVHRLFNELYDAHMANGGVPRFVPARSVVLVGGGGLRAYQ